jgi:hypothetical protein
MGAPAGVRGRARGLSRRRSPGKRSTPGNPLRQSSRVRLRLTRATEAGPQERYTRALRHLPTGTPPGSHGAPTALARAPRMGPSGIGRPSAGHRGGFARSHRHLPEGTRGSVRGMQGSRAKAAGTASDRTRYSAEGQAGVRAKAPITPAEGTRHLVGGHRELRRKAPDTPFEGTARTRRAQMAVVARVSAAHRGRCGFPGAASPYPGYHR